MERFFRCLRYLLWLFIRYRLWLFVKGVWIWVAVVLAALPLVCIDWRAFIGGVYQIVAVFLVWWGVDDKCKRWGIADWLPYVGWWRARPWKRKQDNRASIRAQSPASHMRSVATNGSEDARLRRLEQVFFALEAKVEENTQQIQTLRDAMRKGRAADLEAAHHEVKEGLTRELLGLWLLVVGILWSLPWG